MTAPVEFPVRAWRVEVTQKHINDGMCGNPKKCAITRAIRELEGMDCVRVDLTVRCGSVRVQRAIATFEYRGKAYSVGLPPEVGRFISDFDLAKVVQPFVFEMSLGFAFAVPA